MNIYTEKKRLFLALLMAATSIAGSTNLVFAQNGGPIREYGFSEDSIADNIMRTHSPFSYSGPAIETHGFRISPVLVLLQSYNDNIFASETNTKSDFSTSAGANVKITKNIGRHSISARFKGVTTRYFSQSDENTTNFEVGLSGQLEATRALKFPWEIVHQSAHLDRINTRVESITKEPVAYTESSAKAAIVYNPNRLKIALEGQLRKQRFENGRTLKSGEIAIKNDKDLDSFATTARISYETGTGWEPYIEASYGENDYLRNQHTNTGFNGNSRDFSRTRVVAGTFMDFKQLLVGNFNAGYETRDYDDPDVDSSDGLALNANLTWYPTIKDKIKFRLKHQDTEDNVIAAGVSRWTGELDIEHELLRNFYARFGLDYNTTDFSNIERKDKTMGLNTGLKYIISPSLQIGADYNYIKRDSNDVGYSFDQNIFMLTLTGSL